MKFNPYAHSIYTLITQVVCRLANWQTERWQAAKAQVAAWSAWRADAQVGPARQGCGEALSVKLS